MSTHKHKNSAHKAHPAHPAQPTPVKAAHQPAAAARDAHKTTGTAKAPVAAAPNPNANIQTMIVVALVIAAFFGAYRFAKAATSSGTAAPNGIAAATTKSGSDAGAAGAGAGGCACCGGSGGGAPVEGAATVEGDVQRISVDLSTGSYNPNVIKLKAGVPTEITFGQSGGCTAVVESPELGFREDLTTGPKTVKLAALPAGTYGFACGMNMVTGQFVVE